MKFLSHMRLSDTARKYIMYIIYIIFTVYTLNKLLQEPSIEGKIAYGILLCFFMGVALWAEYLQYLYRHMIASLTMECDPAKARHYYTILKQKDILKSYKNPLYIFDTLYYQDIDQSDTCLAILQDHDHMFRSSLDYLLIRNYTYFYSYYRKGNRTQVKKYYQEVTNVRGAKVKGTKVNPLYSWEFIDALYYYSTKDYKKSLQCFASVYIDNFNPRECSQYFLAYAQTYLALKDDEKARKMLEKVVELGGGLTYQKEAKKLLRNI